MFQLAMYIEQLMPLWVVCDKLWLKNKEAQL